MRYSDSTTCSHLRHAEPAGTDGVWPRLSLSLGVFSVDDVSV